MPELPEVETTRRGQEQHLAGQKIARVVVRDRRLRRPVPRGLATLLVGRTIRALTRRGKYLLIDCGAGTLILHLGMSGRLWLTTEHTPADKHDHFDLVLANHKVVRLRDPRRFGLVLWQSGDPLRHPLLAPIGPEPLSPDFDGSALYRATRNRTAAIKQVLMDGHVVAGVGNIYANEALFAAGIDPSKPARRLSPDDHRRLHGEIRRILAAAIASSGTTVRDYRTGTGEPGGFQLELLVYGREGEPCRRCGTRLTGTHAIDARITVFCHHCQS
jgi:formamidopyrimidine-DNA glycosylase